MNVAPPRNLFSTTLLPKLFHYPSTFRGVDAWCPPPPALRPNPTLATDEVPQVWRASGDQRHGRLSFQFCWPFVFGVFSLPVPVGSVSGDQVAVWNALLLYPPCVQWKVWSPRFTATNWMGCERRLADVKSMQDEADQLVRSAEELSQGPGAESCTYDTWERLNAAREIRHVCANKLSNVLLQREKVPRMFWLCLLLELVPYLQAEGDETPIFGFLETSELLACLNGLWSFTCLSFHTLCECKCMFHCVLPLTLVVPAEYGRTQI